MFFNFKVQICPPKQSYFYTGVDFFKKIMDDPNVPSGGIGRGAVLNSLSILRDYSNSIIYPTDIQGWIEFTCNKMARNDTFHPNMGSLINVDDSSAFQLELENIRESTFCVYDELYNCYGFSDDINKATNAARDRSVSWVSMATVGNMFAVYGKNEMFDWNSEQPVPSNDPYVYALGISNPFFDAFHKECLPYIERNILNIFLDVGSYLTTLNIDSDIFTRNLNPITRRNAYEMHTALQHYENGTELIFKYKEYYPHIFEAYRKLFFLFHTLK